MNTLGARELGARSVCISMQVGSCFLGLAQSIKSKKKTVYYMPNPALNHIIEFGLKSKLDDTDAE